MTTQLPPPFVAIDGVRNFRDFGGYRTQSGRAVVQGKLFRSGAYATITDSGREHFQSLGIATLVDLRRGQERLNSPSQLGGIKLNTILSALGDGDGITLPPHLQYIRDGDLSVESCHDHMLSSYRRIPWEPQHGETFLKTFQTLAISPSPLVIHCAAGKDRTGILCALILHVLGVDEKTIMHDYLLTNKVPLDTPWLNEYAKRMTDMFDKPIDPLTLLPMLGVHQDFLETAWDEMKKRNDGIDGYLDQLGVTPDMRVSLQQALLG